MLTANSPTHLFCRNANKEGHSRTSSTFPFGKGQRHFSEVSYYNNFVKDEYDNINDDRDGYCHHFHTTAEDHLERSHFPFSDMDSSQDNTSFASPLCPPSEFLGHDDKETESHEDLSFENCNGSSSQSLNYNDFDNVASNYFNLSTVDLFDKAMIKLDPSEFPMPPLTENHSSRIDGSTLTSSVAASDYFNLLAVDLFDKALIKMDPSEFPTPFTEKNSSKMDDRSTVEPVPSAIHVANSTNVLDRRHLRSQEDGSFAARAGQPAKRRQVKNACVHCQKACKKCDESRPCHRCVKYGFADTCKDSVRKERKKGVKRGPYKRRIRDRNGMIVPTSKPSIASSSVLSTPRSKVSSLRKQTRQMKMYNRSKVIFPQQEESEIPEEKPKNLKSVSAFKHIAVRTLPPSTATAGQQQKQLGSQQNLPHPAKPSFSIHRLSDSNEYKEIPPYCTARVTSEAPAIEMALHSRIPTTSTVHHYVAAAAAAAAASNAPEPYRAAAAQYASAMSSPASHVYPGTGLPSMFGTTSNQRAIPVTSSTCTTLSKSESKNRWNEDQVAHSRVEDCFRDKSSLQRVFSQPPLPFYSTSRSELVTSSCAIPYLI